MENRNLGARAARWSARQLARMRPRMAHRHSANAAQTDQGELTFDVDTEKDQVRLRLAGELDLATAALLADRLRELEADKPPILVLDLRGLVFMDSSGLRELFAAQRRARDEGRRLVLVKGSEPIDRVLELVKAESAVETVDDPDSI